ncbi:ArdC-like ssDNA-binding domain-containing protein [Dyadobacter sp. CY347]|uniref:ArdC-like ssDNA-binding domain-containing protein n=1 Tax=Dyadobacter sp. CY347 TaxID=2909336 RepID=UPI0038D39B19
MSRDLHTEITAKIIAQLEQKTSPWHKPWQEGDTNASYELPVNIDSGKRYKCINILSVRKRSRKDPKAQQLSIRTSSKSRKKVRRKSINSLSLKPVRSLTAHSCNPIKRRIPFAVLLLISSRSSTSTVSLIRPEPK